MKTIRNDGKVFVQTSIRLSEDIVKKSIKFGINRSAFIEEALSREISRLEEEASQ